MKLHVYASINFYIYPISAIEIENVISNLNTRTSTGPFSIPANILKILKTIIPNQSQK